MFGADQVVCNLGDAFVDDGLGDAFVEDALGGFGVGPGTSFVFSGTSFVFSGTSSVFSGTGASLARPSLLSAYLGDDARGSDDDDGGLRSCTDYDQSWDFDAVDLNTEGNADALFAEDQFALQVRSMSEAGAGTNANIVREANGQIFEGLHKAICGSTEKDLAIEAKEFPDCSDGRKVIEFLQVNNFEAAAEVVAQGDLPFKKVCIEGFVRACKHTSSTNVRKYRSQAQRNGVCKHSTCSTPARATCSGFCGKHAPASSLHRQNGPKASRKVHVCEHSTCSTTARAGCSGFCARHAPESSLYRQKQARPTT
jgi:hypothetical protein